MWFLFFVAVLSADQHWHLMAPAVAVPEAAVNFNDPQKVLQAAKFCSDLLSALLFNFFFMSHLRSSQPHAPC